MEKLNWEYIQDILDRATTGGTGCPATLFDAYHILEKFEDMYAEQSEVDRELQLTLWRDFHRHSAILWDLGFIEIWDLSTENPGWSRSLVYNLYGDEFWPKRVTASGYNFLENLNEDGRHGGKVIELLYGVGVRAARKLGEESLDRVFAIFGS